MSSPPLATILHFFSAIVARTYASLRFPLTPNISSCRSLIFSLAFCERLASVPKRSSFTPESPVRTDRERVSRRSVLPNGKSGRFSALRGAWCCGGVGCGSRWIRPLTEIEKENVKIGTSRTKRRSQTLLKFRNRLREKAQERAGKWERVGRLVVEPLSRFSQEALAAKKGSLVFSFPFFPPLHSLN